MYQNFRNREVTIFLNNAVPIKFMPGEHKELKQEGLESVYASYLRRVDIVKEGAERKEKKAEKGLINEVKQPDKNKELTQEPVEEAAKKGGRKVIKEDPRLSEGYSPWQGESTIASAGRQGKE
jgi:hypothetical protein